MSLRHECRGKSTRANPYLGGQPLGTCLLLLLAALTAVGCRNAIHLRNLEDNPLPQVRVYKTVDGAALKLYVFPPAGANGHQKRPAFLWIHGGGWTSGTPESGFPIARYFAARGIVAFSVEYRLARAGGPFIGDSLADCDAAIRFIRTHSFELGVDPARIAAAGDSAGGHLAAALGTNAGVDAPNAMLLYNPVLDLTGSWGQYAAPGSAGGLSPLLRVHAGMPPTIVLHGLNDIVVPADQSRRFCAAMRAVGNRCDLVLVENAQHAFVLPGYTAPEPVVVKAIRDGDAFLASLGYVSGSPTLQTLAPLPVPPVEPWTARHRQIVEQVRQGGIDLVLIGDSITHNYEMANPPHQNFRPVWDHYYGGRKAANLGVSGDTTGSVLWRIANGEWDGIHPKAAVVLIGTNDTANGAGVEETEAGIEEIVRAVHARSPSTKILLLGILPSGISDAKARADLEVNGLLARRFARQAYVTYIDIGGVFRKDGRPDDSLFYDPHLTPPLPPLHPNTEGQRRMAAAIEPVLCKLLEDPCR